MSGKPNHFLGDTLGRTILKLLVLSFILGIIMAAMDWHPLDVFYLIHDLIAWIWQQGFSAVAIVGEYLVFGAAIVVPVFLLLRLLAYRGNSR